MIARKKLDFTSLHQMKSNLGSATVAEFFFPCIGSLVTLLLCFYLRISKYKIGKKKRSKLRVVDIQKNKHFHLTILPKRLPLNGCTINGFESEWGYTMVIIVTYFVSLSGHVPKMTIEQTQILRYLKKPKTWFDHLSSNRPQANKDTLNKLFQQHTENLTCTEKKRTEWEVGSLHH